MLVDRRSKIYLSFFIGLWLLACNGNPSTKIVEGEEEASGEAPDGGGQSNKVPAPVKPDSAVDSGSKGLTAPPLPPTLTLAGPAADTFINTQERSSTLAILGTVSAVGYTEVGYKLGSSLTVCNASVIYEASAPLANSTSFGLDGVYKVCVALKDSVGVKTYMESPPFTLDTVPAVFTSLALSGDVADGALTLAEYALAGNIVSNLIATDASISEYAVAPIATSCAGPLNYSAAIPKSNDHQFSTTNTYKVCARVSDSAGNAFAYGQSGNISFTASQTFVSLAKTGVGADGYVSNAEKLNTAALWTLNQSGATTITYTAPLDDTSGAATCDGTQTYNQTSIAKATDLSADGPWVICVQLQDTFGHTLFGKSQTITRDILPPSLVSLSASGVGSDAYVSDSEKATTTALWTLTASGHAAFAYSLALSDTSGAQVCDAADSYGQGTTIAGATGLSSDGAWTLCVELTDSAGNVGYGKGQQIVRDIAFPVFTSLALANAATGGYINDSEKLLVNALWTLTASGQAAADYSSALSDTGGAQVCDSSDTYDQAAIATPSSLISDGAFALCVRLTDAAGNIFYGKSQQVMRDVTAPTFTSLNGANEAADAYISDLEKTSTLVGWALVAGVDATAAYTVPLDDTSAAVVCNASKSYSGSTIPLITAMNSDRPWTTCVALTDAAGNITYGKSQQIIRATVTPSVPSAFTATAGNRYIDLKWTSGGPATAGFLLVRGPVGSAPTFVPTNGISYAVGTQGSDEIIYSDAATMKLDNLLTLGATYSYKLYAYNAAYTYTSSVSASAVPVTPCAANYVFVASDPDYGTKDFCVMKYEAKDVGGFASSQASSSPWGEISQRDSLQKCVANGTAYRLISNDEWMTVASSLAGLASNWSGNVVGTGRLYSGHNDNDPPLVCAASTNESLAYVQTDCTPQTAIGAVETRRTLNLANGEVVWDLSGNSWEHVDYYNKIDKPTGGTGYEQFTTVTWSPSLPSRSIIPTQALKSYWLDSWTDTQRIGKFHLGGANGSGGTMHRGGNNGLGTGSGLFTAGLFNGSSSAAWDLGFRCMQNLADIDAATLTLSPGNSQVSASWTSTVGAAGYLLVRGPVGSLPSFQPIDGITYSASSQGADQIVYAGTALSYTNTGLENHRDYFYALFSYNSSTVYSTPARSRETPLVCPTGFVLVPGDKDYATEDFCMMKYEAKNIGSIAASVPLNAPWVYVTQETARTYCSAQANNSHLLTNAEWMTASSQIAALGSNWSGGSVGSGNMFTGHIDGSPSTPCQASAFDSEAFVEYNCLPRSAGQGENSESTQKRTFTLSNGQIIWDLSGNAWEWINYQNKNDKPLPVNVWIEFTGITPTISVPLNSLIPTNALKPFWNDTWNWASQKIGSYRAETIGSGGAFSRGGGVASNADGGIFSANLSASSSSSNYYDMGFRCAMLAQKPNTPQSFTATPSSTSVALSWAKGGSTTAGYLLVRGQAGKLPLFHPSNGTTYTAGSQGSDSIIYVGVGKSLIDAGLTTGGNFHYRVFGYDSAKNYSSGALQSVFITPCPENWVFVPGDADYKTNDFCAMKYEAKIRSNSSTTSQPEGGPYTIITQNESIGKCTAIGPGYHLVSNDEWMTLGANISALGTNWSSGTVGTGALAAGHSDNDPAAACAASSDDTYFYVESDCTPKNTGDTVDQKRTQTLSNGQVVWDLGGNVVEYVNYFNQIDKPGATGSWYQYSSLTGTPTTPLKYLVPTSSVKAFWNDGWNSTQLIGDFYPGSNGVEGVMRRGASWFYSTSAGVFGASLNASNTGADNSTGFRCAQTLPDLDVTALTLVPSSGTISATWASTGATGYMLVRGAAASVSTFVPADGTSYATGPEGSDTILSLGTSLSYNNTGLTNASRYSYALYSYDASDNYTALARGLETPLSCPSGYIHVPGDKDYGTDDFCVMKYEAKNNGSNLAIAQAADGPWVSIDQEMSKTKCTAIGPGYELISNDEWMTIGANAAARGANWTSGTVGTGTLISGHSDNDPGAACAASNDDALAYVESNCTPVSSGDTIDQRRTFILSNSEAIWDFSDNVWEWINYFNKNDKPDATITWTEYSVLTGSTTFPLRNLVPTNAVKAFWSNSWDSAQRTGDIYVAPNGVGGSLRRGGGWAGGGMFKANMAEDPTFTFIDLGFRCRVVRSP